MKKKNALLTLAFLAVFLGSAHAEETDPQAVLREAHALVTQSKYDLALEKLIWFHDHALEASPALAGVRLSYALSEWVELGKLYPKAREALIGIRDQKTAAIEGGQGTFSLFQDVAAINRYLVEEERTYALFQLIHRKYPALAKECFLVAENLLVAHRDYELCLGYISDYLLAFETIRNRREMELGMSKTNPVLDNPQFRDYSEQSFIEKSAQLIEILTGAGRRQEADEIRTKALAVMDKDKLKSAIEAAVLRGGTP